MHEAFRLGINLFDTSPFYGSTKSETVRHDCLPSLMTTLQSVNVALAAQRVCSGRGSCVATVFYIQHGSTRSHAWSHCCRPIPHRCLLPALLQIGSCVATRMRIQSCRPTGSWQGAEGPAARQDHRVNKGGTPV